MLAAGQVGVLLTRKLRTDWRMYLSGFRLRVPTGTRKHFPINPISISPKRVLFWDRFAFISETNEIGTGKWDGTPV